MTDKPTLLVVDDKKNMLRLMAKVMRPHALVRTAEDGAKALRILAKEPVDAVLCDLKMPDMDGLEVLRAAKRLRPGAEFVLMTAYATVGTAVEALKLGAFDYLTKPFEPDVASAVLLRALARTWKRSDEEGIPEVLPGVIARSRAMEEIGGLVRTVAKSDATVLILGETGTGKERVARAIHSLSGRSQRKFIAINCAAIPAELLESELFGHAKGAFTGANTVRKGMFEEANRGTLFLDEIGDMRPSLQAKLTRVLEERAVRRIGESEERPIDVRLVAATHQDVEAMVASGRFREDLWYRLNVALVRLPALRDREEDVQLLARFFFAQHLERGVGTKAAGISEAALEALSAYRWPGNVRQLRSAIERAAVLAKGQQINISDLPPEMFKGEGVLGPDPALTAGTWAEALERGRVEYGRRYLESVMERFRGKVSAAAEHAGVERESFYRLLRQHDVDPAQYRLRSKK